jgi:spermidine/putrescine-binding protein
MAGAVVATSVLGEALAGCGSSSQSSTSAGEEVGGRLTTLDWAGYSSPKASEPFRNRYGVSVNEEPLTSNGDIITKLLAGGADSISAVTPPMGLVPLAVQAGVLEPLDYDRLPNAADYIPYYANLGEKTFAIDGQTYAAPFLWGTLELVYNEQYLAQPPSDWMEFTEPEFTGKLALTDVPEDNYQCWGEAMGYDPLKMTKPQLEKVTDFLIQFKTEQVRTFTNTYDDLAQELASGDIVAVASPLWIAIAGEAKKHGSNSVKWKLLDKGCRRWTDTWALPKGGNNQDTAYAWINYMIGANAQAIVASELQSATVNRKAIPKLTGPAKTLYPYNNPEAARRTPTWTLPTGENGAATYDDWLEEWRRVQAA